MYILPVIPKINKWNKIQSNMFPVTNCTKLICFDKKLDNTLGLKRITKYLRDITYLNSNSVDVLIGLLLGDAYFKTSSHNHNKRIGFKQSIINFPFMWTVFTELSHYCSSLPRIEYTTLKTKRYKLITLETRSYPIRDKLYNILYINNRKSIQPELFHYLTPKALAYWIMSDGISAQYGLILCTDSFSIKEVTTLINILIIRYNFNCSIHFANKKPRIYIKAQSIVNLRQLVIPYFIPFSMYKLQKGKRYNQHRYIISTTNQKSTLSYIGD